MQIGDAGVVAEKPLLPLPEGCIVGRFVRRVKRFSVELDCNGETVWVHSNNSGSMLGLMRKGAPVLASPAANPDRKLRYTQELVWFGNGGEAVLAAYAAGALCHVMKGEGEDAQYAQCLAQCAHLGVPAVPGSDVRGVVPQGFWVGVNTSTPNRLLEAAFYAGKLPWAAGYTSFRREKKRGESRLDACLEGPGLPPLWVECKNVTMVEDDMACFPDAASERAAKHLREMMDIVRGGERAATFYLIQRPDGRCFGPAAMIDPVYAELFAEARAAGVEMYPHRAVVSPMGIGIGGVVGV